jgi:hypothetical protein
MGTFNCGIGWCTSDAGGVDFVRVLLIPCLGRFMCPFAVAGLGFKYLRINVSLMPGHPLKYPRRVLFSRLEIFGLHDDWCANFTALARVVTKCVNIAIAGIGGIWGARPFTGLGRGNVCIPILLVVADSGVVPIFPRGIGNVHRSVAWSFVPAKITAPLYHTLHFSLSKTALHPALHKGQSQLGRLFLMMVQCAQLIFGVVQVFGCRKRVSTVLWCWCRLANLL